MAMVTELSDVEFNELYDQVDAKVAACAELQYQAALSAATTPKQRQACAGHYPSEWSHLFQQWLEGRVDTQIVHDSLQQGHVIAY